MPANSQLGIANEVHVDLLDAGALRADERIR
jgi:hypothetical protein